MSNRLISLEEGLNFDRRQVREYSKRYVNPALANLLGLLNFDKQYVRAQGCRVWDEDGEEYLDFLGGYGALNLGHNHPEIHKAIEKVFGAPVLLQASLNKLTAVLAHNLAQVAPGDLCRTFFCNSGAEAVEGALKLARIVTGRKDFIYCEGSFHGKTLGSLSVTGRKKYQDPFQPLIPGAVAIPYGDLESLERALEKKTAAAFIVEPIQGEGGIVVPPPGYLQKAQELCHRYETLLIIDEVQTGFGRTGTLFACEAENVVPDILCLAKSLGGGIMPAGAFMTKERHWDKAYGSAETCLLHTSTFGGNTIAMAAGINALKVTLEENLAGQAREKGEYLLKKIQEVAEKSKLIREVRGRGLMIGLEFAPLSKGILNRVTAGILNKLGQEYLGAMVAGELNNRYRIITAYTLNNPNVIRLEPPLIVTKEELDRVVNALEEIVVRRGIAGIALNSGKTALSSLFGHR
ncbi:MAG: aspartate aminotransferase family protein [Dethiobacteria bacterium]|jgi:putrescine aminotransferase|nr:aspartate aminotransferase family protein [Bacillota bacterium]